MTAAVVRPLPDPRDIERAFKRAVLTLTPTRRSRALRPSGMKLSAFPRSLAQVLADAENADILRQLETFATEYDKYGRGERIHQCIICKGGQLCEVRAG